MRILGVTQKTITERGPGAMTGKPQTTFTVEFVNHSRAPIELNQVVVTVAYGHPKTSAAPVYGGDTEDFGGTVAPGKSIQTHYAFSIPTAQLSDVTMAVTFDGLHAAATFRGVVRTQ